MPRRVEANRQPSTHNSRIMNRSAAFQRHGAGETLITGVGQRYDRNKILATGRPVQAHCLTTRPVMLSAQRTLPSSATPRQSALTRQTYGQFEKPPQTRRREPRLPGNRHPAGRMTLQAICLLEPAMPIDRRTIPTSVGALGTGGHRSARLKEETNARKRRQTTRLVRRCRSGRCRLAGARAPQRRRPVGTAAKRPAAGRGRRESRNGAAARNTPGGRPHRLRLHGRRHQKPGPRLHGGHARLHVSRLA